MKKYLLFAIFICFYGSASAENLNVQLHDGRSIQVERLTSEKREGRWGDPFFGLPINPRSERVGDVTKLVFTNPKTREIISWQSEPNYTPLILDFYEDVPYLVIHGAVSKDTQAVYGCPELPYFFLKYGSGYSGGWRPISVENAPEFLRQANLPIPSRYDGDSIQTTIPRSYDEWNYKYKKNHRDERNVWDCRPPRTPPRPVDLPEASVVNVEVLDAVIFELDKIYVQSEWAPHHFYLKEEKSCKKTLILADDQDTYKGRRFFADTSKLIEVPYTDKYGRGEVVELCDEDVLFVSRNEWSGFYVFTKYSLNGNLKYRIAIQNPAPVSGYFGTIRIPSIRFASGYLSFEFEYFIDRWSKSAGSDGRPDKEWHVKKVISMRVKEPG